MTNYTDFLAAKKPVIRPTGIEVAPSDINPKLFLFQRDCVRRALHLGKYALFANVGLGKTGMQLEWARHVVAQTNGKVLILTPLAVAEQTVAEGIKFNVEVKHVETQSEVGSSSIVVTNYDRLHLFDPKQFTGVVLDESSCLKHYSKTFFSLTETFKDTPFRLCCTATPAPNDFVEFGNHSMFLGIMHFKDMLARWFVGEGDVARSARLKGHAREDFWRWLTEWSVCISRPADLGPEYDMAGYDLPPHNIHEHRLGVNQATIDRAQKSGRLMPDTNPSATKFQAVKKESLADRVEKVREIVAGIDPSEPIILWCDTDFEADALRAAFPGAVEVRGSHTRKRKEDTLKAFSQGKERVIITKPSVAGFGLNWQHCCKEIFVGVSFSFESTYQAMGRIHRFGQTRPVDTHIIYAETEGNVMQLLKRKQADFQTMQAEMTTAIRGYGLFRSGAPTTVFAPAKSGKAEGKDWTYYLGDCVPATKAMPDNSVDLTIHSPPFSSLYIYSDSEADIGNSATKEEFFEHYNFLIEQLLRVTRPGRCCAVHVKDLPLFQNRDGVMGIDPFSDDVTAAFRRAGWVLQSRVTVEKDPVIEMEKTNSHGLLYKNWRERAELLRTGLPDYVLIFQKPGDDRERRVLHNPDDKTYFGDNPPQPHEWLELPTKGTGHNNFNLPVWQRYANPNWSDVVVPLVWTDIDQTDVLNYLIAKGNKDERHICPLQLDLIARIIHWKSNPGDVVLDPFGGIASTGYEALRLGRKFIGVELKEEYHRLGIKYLKEAEALAGRPTLFDWAEQQAKPTPVPEPN